MADYIDTTLVDGFAGGPHITEEQIGLINQGTYGPDDYVLEEGSQAEAEVLTNNSIRIKDAVFVIQGRRDVMAANDYEDISIDNGAQGVNRNDIIVRRYQKDESSEIENTSFAVIKGTATEGAATDPEVPTGDIRTGALLHNMKLYRVRIEGLNIVAVEPLFKVLMNAKSVQEMLAELNSKTINIEINSETVDTSFGYIRATQSGKVVVVSAAVRVRAAIGTYSGMTLATGLPNPLGGTLQGSALSKDGTYASCVFEIGDTGGFRLDSRFQSVSSGDTFLGQIVYLCQ
mgnify:CR=1 FL=1